MACPQAAEVMASESARMLSRGVQLTCIPSKLGFGKVAVGQGKSSTVTSLNSGSSSSSIPQSLAVATRFSMSGLNLPLVPPKGSSFAFRATFAPLSNRPVAGTGYIVSNASNPVLTILPAGTGADAGQLVVTPALVNFGDVAVGSSEPETGMLSAADSAVTVASGIIDNSEFTLSGLSFPVSIPAGQSISFTVTFTPQNNGFASGTLIFVSDASNPPTVEPLTATGTAQYPVALSWTASTSPNVMGYNIYRGNASGGPYSKINPALDPNTAYTDNSVSDGQTYYYVVTAVNSDSEESAYSNEAKAVIP